MTGKPLKDRPTFNAIGLHGMASIASFSFTRLPHGTRSSGLSCPGIQFITETAASKLETR